MLQKLELQGKTAEETENLIQDCKQEIFQFSLFPLLSFNLKSAGEALSAVNGIFCGKMEQAKLYSLLVELLGVCDSTFANVKNIENICEEGLRSSQMALGKSHSAIVDTLLAQIGFNGDKVIENCFKIANYYQKLGDQVWETAKKIMVSEVVSKKFESELMLFKRQLNERVSLTKEVAEQLSRLNQTGVVKEDIKTKLLDLQEKKFQILAEISAQALEIKNSAGSKTDEEKGLMILQLAILLLMLNSEILLNLGSASSILKTYSVRLQGLKQEVNTNETKDEAFDENKEFNSLLMKLAGCWYVWDQVCFELSNAATETRQHLRECIEGDFENCNYVEAAIMNIGVLSEKLEEQVKLMKQAYKKA